MTKLHWAIISAAGAAFLWVFDRSLDGLMGCNNFYYEDCVKPHLAVQTLVVGLLAVTAWFLASAYHERKQP